MLRLHHLLAGLGIAGIMFEYFNGIPHGKIGIGVPLGVAALGLFQWFLADAVARRLRAAAASSNGGTPYGKYHYHDLV